MKQIFVVTSIISVLLQVALGAPSIQYEKELPPLSIDQEDRINFPESPGNFSDLRYFLWTRSNPGDEEYYIMEPFDSDNLANSNFNGDLPTYVLNPGWTDFGDAYWIVDAKTELLQMKDCNIISIDWGLVVPGPFNYYYDDTQMMYRVAESNAQLLDWLIDQTTLTVEKIEMVGHSLGAHAIGMTALYMTSGRISRLTGLDPAGPLFYNKTAETRLDKSQADFVDIIHSNGGPAYDACYGIGQSLGHVDFYPNGGVHQPRCVLNTNSSGGPHLMDATGCSHQRAVQYWVETIAHVRDPVENEDFLAWPCQDWDSYQANACTSCGQGCSSMGFNADRKSTGSYFLRTHFKTPFAMGDNQGN